MGRISNAESNDESSIHSAGKNCVHDAVKSDGKARAKAKSAPASPVANSTASSSTPSEGTDTKNQVNVPSIKLESRSVVKSPAEQKPERTSVASKTVSWVHEKKPEDRYSSNAEGGDVSNSASKTLPSSDNDQTLRSRKRHSDTSPVKKNNRDITCKMQKRKKIDVIMISDSEDESDFRNADLNSSEDKHVPAGLEASSSRTNAPDTSSSRKSDAGSTKSTLRKSFGAVSDLPDHGYAKRSISLVEDAEVEVPVKKQTPRAADDLPSVAESVSSVVKSEPAAPATEVRNEKICVIESARSITVAPERVVPKPDPSPIKNFIDLCSEAGEEPDTKPLVPVRVNYSNTDEIITLDSDDEDFPTSQFDASSVTDMPDFADSFEKMYGYPVSDDDNEQAVVKLESESSMWWFEPVAQNDLVDGKCMLKRSSRVEPESDDDSRDEWLPTSDDFPTVKQNQRLHSDSDSDNEELSALFNNRRPKPGLRLDSESEDDSPDKCPSTTDDNRIREQGLENGNDCQNVKSPSPVDTGELNYVSSDVDESSEAEEQIFTRLDKPKKIVTCSDRQVPKRSDEPERSSASKYCSSIKGLSGDEIREKYSLRNLYVSLPELRKHGQLEKKKDENDGAKTDEEAAQKAADDDVEKALRMLHREKSPEKEKSTAQRSEERKAPVCIPARYQSFPGDRLKTKYSRRHPPPTVADIRAKKDIKLKRKEMLKKLAPKETSVESSSRAAPKWDPKPVVAKVTQTNRNTKFLEALTNAHPLMKKEKKEKSPESKTIETQIHENIETSVDLQALCRKNKSPEELLTERKNAEARRKDAEARRKKQTSNEKKTGSSLAKNFESRSDGELLDEVMNRYCPPNTTSGSAAVSCPSERNNNEPVEAKSSAQKNIAKFKIPKKHDSSSEKESKRSGRKESKTDGEKESQTNGEKESNTALKELNSNQKNFSTRGKESKTSSKFMGTLFDGSSGRPPKKLKSNLKKTKQFLADNSINELCKKIKTVKFNVARNSCKYIQNDREERRNNGIFAPAYKLNEHLIHEAGLEIEAAIANICKWNVMWLQVSIKKSAEIDQKSTAYANNWKNFEFFAVSRLKIVPKHDTSKIVFPEYLFYRKVFF